MSLALHRDETEGCGVALENNKLFPELYGFGNVISRIHVVQEVRFVAEKRVVAKKELGSLR
jgi:hypothetical protein